jgi:hypothetical protein
VVPLHAPDERTIPEGPVGDAIRYGKKVLTETQRYAQAYVGNGLNCTSCHLDAGRKARASPWVGDLGCVPEYRSRSGTINALQDRINDCFERSMNVKLLSPSVLCAETLSSLSGAASPGDPCEIASASLTSGAIAAGRVRELATLRVRLRRAPAQSWIHRDPVLDAIGPGLSLRFAQGQLERGMPELGSRDRSCHRDDER